jgi:hypothetical protein
VPATPRLIGALLAQLTMPNAKQMRTAATRLMNLGIEKPPRARRSIGAHTDYRMSRAP